MKSNIDDQFEKWTKQWDKALEDGLFPKDEKPKSGEARSNFFGQSNIPDSQLDPEEDSVSYWKDIASYAEADEHQLLNENKTKKVAKSSNPVDYTNLGKDSKNTPTEDWTEGDSLTKLNELKKKLYDLECSFLSKHAMGVKEKDLEIIKKEMEKVSTLIDKISDKMGSLRLTPEPK
jgi:hypothetical protein